MVDTSLPLLAAYKLVCSIISRVCSFPDPFVRDVGKHLQEAVITTPEWRTCPNVRHYLELLQMHEELASSDSALIKDIDILLSHKAAPSGLSFYEVCQKIVPVVEHIIRERGLESSPDILALLRTLFPVLLDNEEFRAIVQSLTAEIKIP